MTVSRRKILQLTAGALPLLGRAASAETYPSRPVHLVIGFPPGQTADITARLVGDFMSRRLGQTFVIDNKPGAASTIATEFVVRAAPDGYTLLGTVASNLINATLMKLPYDFSRDIEPVASITLTPIVLEVHPSIPVKTVPEFIAYAKERPGKLNMASGGIGNSTHMAGELFQMMTGIKLTHVPYRGSAPAITDLIAGQVQVMFDLLGSSIEQINAGKLRPIAVTTTKTVDALPGLPTIAQFVPGYEAYGLGGLGAPKGTPREIVARLNEAVQAAIADPTVKARLEAFGSIPLPGSSDDFRNLIASEIDKWGKVIKFAGIKPEKV
jgi:tripartite-type tricarboxylate transporter receptor subunit TctC